MSAAIRAGYKQTEVGGIPEDWAVVYLSEISTKITDGEHVTPIRTKQGHFLLSARNVLNGRIDVSDVDYVGDEEFDRIKQRCNPEPGDVLISCSGTIGRVTVVPDDFECVLVRSAALAKLDRAKVDGGFIQFWLQAGHAQGQIFRSVNQGAQPNLFLNHIERLQCPAPSLHEQRAIAAALSDVDALLAKLDEFIAKKRDLKQAAMQQLLTGQTRLPGFRGAWEVKRLGELLAYEQPTKYLVSSSEYNDANTVPVLTAGKTFVLGYTNEDDGIFNNLPVIIFDDFTTANKYVTFPFKAKSSAMKLLRPRNSSVNLRLVYEIMQLIEFKLGDHKRYWISEYQKLEVKIPDAIEQTAIATILSDMDAELSALEARRDKTRALKQGMMQELLTGRIRLI